MISRYLEINSGKVDLLKMTLIPRIFNENSFFEYDGENVINIIRVKDNHSKNRTRSSSGNNLMKFRESRYVEE